MGRAGRSRSSEAQAAASAAPASGATGRRPTKASLQAEQRQLQAQQRAPRGCVHSLFPKLRPPPLALGEGESVLLLAPGCGLLMRVLCIPKP